jgi:uncharacterized protein (TIGR03437 family)
MMLWTINIRFAVLAFSLSLTLSAQGIIETAAGGKSRLTFDPPKTPLSFPTAAALDTRGNFYFISDEIIFKLEADTGVLRRIAGNGANGFSGDGGPAVDANFSGPIALVADAAGNLFIADTESSLVRKVDPAGMVTTVAGNGKEEFNGDGGPAVRAGLAEPGGLAVDASGNMFIADARNSRIRKLDRAGIITTFAGNGTEGFSGDGGPAVNASLGEELPGLAIDSAGNLFIADSDNQRIRKVTPDGIITTFAGNSSSGFSGDGGPAVNAALSGGLGGLAIDALGNLFIADCSNHRIRRVDRTGIITTVAGNGTAGFTGDGGPAVNAALNMPDGVAVDAAGNLIITDHSNHRVRKVDGAGIISTIAGDGEMSFTGNSAVFGGDGGPAVDAVLSDVNGLAVDRSGNVFIGSQYPRIRKIDSSGFITTIAGNGTQGFAGDGGRSVDALLGWFHDLATDTFGNLFVADAENRRVRKIDSSGVITTVAGSSAGGFIRDGGLAVNAAIGQPSGVATDAAGNLFILSPQTDSAILKVDSAGILTTVSRASIQSGLGCVSVTPRGLAVDSAGTLFYAEPEYHRVRRVDTRGAITTLAGSDQDQFVGGFSGDGGRATAAKLNCPNDVAMDAAGNLYIADTGNDRIRKVDRAGIITTVVGNGVRGFGGDGGPPTGASLNRPTDVAVDVAGNLFIGDTNNRRVRRVSFTTEPRALSVVSAASGQPGAVAPGSIVSIYGEGLAGALEVGTGTAESLGGTGVQIIDATRTTRRAGLYFVSPNQINAVIPSGAALGSATVTVQRGAVAAGSRNIQIDAVTPALFSANADGRGVAAAVVLTVSANGSQSSYTAAQYDVASGRSVPVAIDLGPSGTQVYLLLFGTGIRGFASLSQVSASVGGQAVPVVGAAAQSQYPGMDQVNLGPLPRSLAGRGDAEIALIVSGKPANVLTIQFR